MPTQTRNPTSVFSSSSVSYSSGTNGWDLVNDYPDMADPLTSYVQLGTAANAHITFGFTPFNIPEGSIIIGVTVRWTDEEPTSGLNYSSARLYINGGYYSYDLTRSPESYTQNQYMTWKYNPYNFKSWEINDVNGTGSNPLQYFGIIGSESNPVWRLGSIQIEVEYIETPPTIRVRTVKPTGQGGNYTSLEAWMAGEQANLVSLNEIRVAEIDGDWSGGPDTSDVGIDGWTTDIARYIEIRAVGAARHNGKFDPTKYYLRYGAWTWNTCFNMYGIQLEYIDIGYGIVNIDSCIIRNLSGTNAFYSISNVLDKQIISNLLVFKGGGSSSYGIRYDESRPNVFFYNCTVFGFNVGFKNGYDNTPILKNCLAQNCTDGFNGIFHSSSTNNCSNITSDAPGSNPVTGTVQFIDAANGDFRLSPYDTIALGAGAILYSDATYPVTTDIAGNSRGTSSVTKFDIGASHAMERIRKIMPSGGSYTSLSAWEAAEQDDLVANNKNCVGEIDGTWGAADATGTDIVGWTTGPYNRITIRAINNARQTGKWDTTKYIKSTTGNSSPIYSNEAFVIFDGFQIVAASDVAANGYHCLFLGANLESNNQIIVKNMLINKGGNATYYNSGIQISDSAANVIILNCIIFNPGVPNSQQCGIRCSTNTLIVYNTTSISTNRSIRMDSGTCYCINTYSGVTNSEAYAGSGTIYLINAASSDATGSVNYRSIPYNNTTFVSATTDVNADLRLKLGSQLLCRGVNLATGPNAFFTDIAGKRRPALWDIGAHQFTEYPYNLRNVRKVGKIRKLKS